jgi:hypothetical protein
MEKPMKRIVVLSACAFLALGAGKAPHSDLLRAIHQVEASGSLTPPDGDGGRSIGPFQISRAYWADAVEHQPSLGGEWGDCRDYQYARRVVLAYFARYGGENPTDERLARQHNGGPSGHRKAATLGYWAKVKAQIGGAK